MTQEISLCGERLFLLPERAIWWPEKRTIILSDVHWGKSAHFRKNGIPMPGSQQQEDARRLSSIIQNFGAEELIIAGDLFHSRHNQEVADFKHWRDAHDSLHIHFVMGNHDILPATFYDDLGFQVYPEGMLNGPFYVTHDAIPDASAFVIHGHLHPGVHVSGAGMRSRAFPCFCIASDHMILPAFGSFTGCKRVSPEHFKHLYLVGEQQVLQLK